MTRKVWLPLLFVVLLSSLCFALEGTVMIFPDLIVSTPERFDSANDYPLPLLADRVLNTTWTFKWDFDSYSGDWDQDGISSWLKIETISGTEIRSIEIINGYAKMWPVRYIENNAVMALIVEESSGNKQTVQFDDDYQDFQEIRLKKPSSSVKLIIDDIRNGSKYNDTCIGEMAVFDTKGNDLITKWPYYVFTYGEANRIWQVRGIDANVEYTATMSNINWAVVNSNADLLAFYGAEGVEVYDVKTGSATKLYEDKKVTSLKIEGRKVTTTVEGVEQSKSF